MALAAENMVRFRPGRVRGELASRGEWQARGLTARRDLERYYELLAHAMANVRSAVRGLSENQLERLCHALGAVEYTSVLDSRALIDAGEHIQASEMDLEQFRRLGECERAALRDAAERFERQTSDRVPLDERLLLAGLRLPGFSGFDPAPARRS